MLLKLLADEPRHGYDLIRAIETLSGGAYAPSPGVVYPTLTLLADMDLIAEIKDEGPRRLLAITSAGHDHLASHQAECDAAFERLAGLAALRAKTDAAPIRRAIHNLKAVLHDRLGRDDVTRETVLDVAALIDQTASKIERM